MSIIAFDTAPLRRDDHARWMELWRAYQEFYGVAIPADASALTWARLMDGRVCGFGARDSTGRLVGIAHFLFHADTWSVRSACYLEDLYVDEVVRGSGCARVLIEAVAAAARARDAAPPYWLTHESNAAARRLYERVAKNLGFIQYVMPG